MDDGFTLVEILIVLALVVVVFSIGLPVAFDFYRNYELIAERDSVLTILREARNRALVNVGSSSHGVFFDTDKYIVFEGGSFSTRRSAFDQNFVKSGFVTISGPSEITFSALSGQTSSSSFSLTNNIRTVKIYVNSAGLIDWEL